MNLFSLLLFVISIVVIGVVLLQFARVKKINKTRGMIFSTNLILSAAILIFADLGLENDINIMIGIILFLLGFILNFVFLFDGQNSDS